MKIKLNLDPVCLPSKTHEHIDITVSRLKSESTITEVTKGELQRAVIEGRAFTPGVLNGRYKENWTQQQLFVIDIDNDNDTLPHLTPDGVLQALQAVNIPVAFMYYSYSSKPEKLKFRVVMVCSEVVTDPAECVQISKGLYSLFPYSYVDTIVKKTGKIRKVKKSQVDLSCFNIERFFYGTCNGLIEGMGSSGVFLDKAAALALYESDTKAPKAEKPIGANYIRDTTPPPTAPKMSYTIDEWTALEQAAGVWFNPSTYTREFNLLEYVRANFGGKEKTVGGQIRFNPCPICGGMDRFSIDPARPHLFICFGDSCCGGGNVHNFIQETQGLNERGARDFIKYELLGISQQAERTLYAVNKKADELKAAQGNRETPSPSEPEINPTKYIHSMADIKPRNVEYVKYPFFPRGEVTSVTGMMDTGKTFLLLKVMLDVANGKEWHTEQYRPGYNPFSGHGVAVGFFAEDAHDTSLANRLKMMTSSPDELRNVIVVDTSDRRINWKIGGTAMEAVIAEVTPDIVIIDTGTRFAPITTRAGKPFNENSKQDVSEVMDILEQYARKYNCSLVITNHPNKQQGQSASHRTSGSQEWLNGVRSGWLLARNPEDDNCNILACIKQNHIFRREHRRSILLPFSPETGVSIGDYTDVRADDIKDRRLSDRKESEQGITKQSPKTIARIWLFEHLDKKGGAALVEDILKRGHEDGIKAYRLREVVRESKGAIMSTGAGANQKAYWYTEDGKHKVPPEQMKIDAPEGKTRASP